MKRAPELRYLSDHHHQGLVQARRLRRAATGEERTTPKETAEVLKFWQEETTAHFREEEEVLLPVLARYGGGAERGPVSQMLAQHPQIRGLVMELSDEVRNGAVKAVTLEGLGESLL